MTIMLVLLLTIFPQIYNFSPHPTKKVDTQHIAYLPQKIKELRYSLSSTGGLSDMADNKKMSVCANSKKLCIFALKLLTKINANEINKNDVLTSTK
jgi:hypothetical protein